MGMFGKVPGNEKPRENPEEGKYPAVLYLLVDLGTHKDEYKGEMKFKRKIHLGWELVGTKMSDGRPFAVFEEYNVTPSKYDSGFYFPPNSNLHKMLKTWTGADEAKCKSAGFLEFLLDEQIPGTITIEHAQGKKDPSKTYANIESIKPYKGVGKLARVNDPVKYLIGGSTDGFPESLTWLKKKIGQALEFNGGVPPQSGDDNTDIPF